MKNCIILHGGPDKEEYYDPNQPSVSNAHWFPWLQNQLLIHDIPTATPEVPFAFDRTWEVWKKEVERFDIGPKTILVGHSTGAGFFIKYLSLHPHISIDKLILVAPWIDPDKTLTTDMFLNFTIDPDLVTRTKGVTIFFSTDDDTKGVRKSVSILREKLRNITYREFQNHGHFCIEDMHTVEFPELLQCIIDQ